MREKELVNIIKKLKHPPRFQIDHSGIPKIYRHSTLVPSICDWHICPMYTYSYFIVETISNNCRDQLISAMKRLN